MSVLSNISVSLTADANGVKRGVSQAKASLTDYGKSVKGISTGNPFAASIKGANSMNASMGVLTKSIASYGAAMAAAFSVGAIASGIKGSLAFMDSQAELAQQLQVSVKELSGLGYISDVVGGNTEALSSSIAKMQKLFGNAANGQKAATDTLAKYNLTAKQLIGLPLSEQMGILSDKFNSLTSQEQKMVFATDMFGKSGADMINMLSLGGGEIDKMIKKAEDLGVVFDASMAKKASDAEDAMLALSMATKGLGMELATSLAPAITTAANAWAGWIAELNKSNAMSDVWNKIKGAVGFTASVATVVPSAIAAGASSSIDMKDTPAAYFAGIGNEGFNNTNSAQISTQEKQIALESQRAREQALKNPLPPPMLRKPESASTPDSYTSSVYKDMFTVKPELGPTVSDETRKKFDAEWKVAKDMDGVWKKINAEKEKEQAAAAKAMEDAEKEKQRILEDQTKELEAQTKERERAADVQGGFLISKAGRTAAGGDYTIGGAMASISQGGGDMGFNNKDQQIVSELQEQTGYLRALVAKPNVPVFG